MKVLAPRLVTLGAIHRLIVVESAARCREALGRGELCKEVVREKVVWPRLCRKVMLGGVRRCTIAEAASGSKERCRAERDGLFLLSDHGPVGQARIAEGVGV